MNSRGLITFFVLLAFQSTAQPGKPKVKTLSFGIFDSVGQPVTRQAAAYTITLQTDYADKGTKTSAPGVVRNSNKYYINTTDGYPVILTIQHGRQTMTIRNLNEGIDSIAFLPGDYMIVYTWAPIFGVKLYGGARLVNFDLSNMKSGSVVLPPFVRFYGHECPAPPNDTVVNCYRYAQQIEAIHGGSGWVNSVYSELHGADSLTKRRALRGRLSLLMNTDQRARRVRIYPLQKKAWLMHEHIIKDNTGYPNMHRLSISYDRGRSWHPLIAVPGEWNTRLVFFAQGAFIGIASSGYMLVSDNSYKAWTYYRFENPLPEPEEGLPGTMLTAEGWKKNMSSVFAFSRQPDALPTPHETISLDVTSDGVQDSIYFTTRLAHDLLIPTMSCACGAKDFYYRLYRQTSEGWTLARDHTEGPTSKRCECKSRLAQLMPGHRYSIPPIHTVGKYFLELVTADGIKHISSAFRIGR